MTKTLHSSGQTYQKILMNHAWLTPQEGHFKQFGPIARLPGGPFTAPGSEDKCGLTTVDFLEMSLPRSVGPKDNQTGHQCILQTDL